MGNSINILTQRFEAMTAEQRLSKHKEYSKIIAEHNGTAPDKYYPSSHKRAGQKIERLTMSWMLPAWERGIRILEEVMSEKGELEPNPSTP